MSITIQHALVVPEGDSVEVKPLMPELVLQDDLIGLVSGYFETARPFMQQLCRAVGVPY